MTPLKRLALLSSTFPGPAPSQTSVLPSQKAASNFDISGALQDFGNGAKLLGESVSSLVAVQEHAALVEKLKDTTRRIVVWYASQQRLVAAMGATSE